MQIKLPTDGTTMTDGVQGNKALERPMTREAYRKWLWTLLQEEQLLHPETVGVTAGGETIYGVSVGEGGPCVVYYGGLYRGDWLSTAVLLGFLVEYSRKMREGGWLYRVHLPQLYAHRRLCVCPALNIDGMGMAYTGNGENGWGVDIRQYFEADGGKEGVPVPERCPEGSVWQQYLHYKEPGLLLGINGMGKAQVKVPSQPSPRAGTTGRLLSGMVHVSTSAENEAIPAWYGKESGQPSYEIGLGLDKEEQDVYHKAYAMVREMLFTAPLLI